MLLSPLLSGYQPFATLSSALFKKYSEGKNSPRLAWDQAPKWGIKTKTEWRSKKIGEQSEPSSGLSLPQTPARLALFADFVSAFSKPLSQGSFSSFERTLTTRLPFTPELRRLQVQSYHVTNVIQSFNQTGTGWKFSWKQGLSAEVSFMYWLSPHLFTLSQNDVYLFWPH